MGLFRHKIGGAFPHLSMHTFVTGSTGSGKSNTVYEILRQLDMVGIHFLVIEPAKGEYKNASSLPLTREQGFT